ncbi:hypothetical protein K3495_g11414 [Podosphaera aphanis]|nr:hypothetical protein K3495_g11414 [Podosphaera aphanis]
MDLLFVWETINNTNKQTVPVFKRTVAPKPTDYPQDLQAVVEAEKRLADRVFVHSGIYSTAINSVEAALSPLSTGENTSFVDGIKVHLWAAITQYIHTGPGSTPPLLPPRPMIPAPKVSESRVPTTTTLQAQVPTNTWTTVARKSLRNAEALTPQKAAPPAKSTKKPNYKTKVDGRLFLRLEESSDLHKLSLAGVKEMLTLRLGFSEEKISSFQRVKTGYAGPPKMRQRSNQS